MKKKEIFITDPAKNTSLVFKEFYMFLNSKTDHFENINHGSLIIQGPFCNVQNNTDMYIIEYETLN